MTIERWAPVAGYEGVYEVSDLGRVRSVDRLIHRSTGAVERHKGRILSQHKTGHGYLFVPLCKNGSRKSAYVHRLVAAAFLPVPDGPHVNHIDFDKTNNAWSNLEWVTAKENMHHRLAAEPGLPAAEASTRMQAVYAARAKPPAVRHPKVKPCAVCGVPFTPPATKRATQQACSPKCGGVLSGLSRRQPGSTRSATYATPVLARDVINAIREAA